MSLPMHLSEAVAISSKDFRSFGCPNCGCLLHHTLCNIQSCKLCICADCSYSYVVLLDASLQHSNIGLGRTGGIFYPSLVRHPRHGSVASKYLANRLADSEQFFRVRGSFFDLSPGCFACQRASGVHKSIIGYALSMETAVYIVEMFSSGVSLQESDGNAQIKIGACGDHLLHLDTLYRRLRQSAPVISKDIISQALRVK